MFKKTVLAFLSAIIASSGMLYAQEAFSIEEAVQYAIKNHYTVKKDAINIADAEEQMRLIRASGLPQINGSVDYNYFVEVPQMVLPPEFDPTGELGSVSFQLRNSLATGVNLGMLAFDGSYLVALKAAKVYRDFVATQVEQSPINLRNAVTQAYYSVLLVERNKAQLEKNLEVLRSIRKEVDAIFQNGLNEKLDVDRIDLSISSIEATMKNLDRGREVVENLLKFQMQYPADQNIVLKDSFEDLFEHANTYEQLAVAQLNINNRVEYRIMGKGIELASMDITRYKKGYLPNLSIFGSFQRTFQTNNIFKEGGQWLPTSVVGFSLGVPIFDGFMKDANIQKARLTVENNQLDRAEFERAVNLEVKNAQSNYLNAIETSKDRMNANKLAEEIYQVAQIKYKEGIGSSFEVRQAESDLYTAQANYISAQYEVISTRFALQKALGVYN